MCDCVIVSSVSVNPQEKTHCVGRFVETRCDTQHRSLLISNHVDCKQRPHVCAGHFRQAHVDGFYISCTKQFWSPETVCTGYLSIRSMVSFYSEASVDPCIWSCLDKSPHAQCLLVWVRGELIRLTLSLIFWKCGIKPRLLQFTGYSANLLS